MPGASVFSIFASDLQTVEERIEAVEKQTAAAEQKIEAEIEAEKIEAGENQKTTEEQTEAEKTAEGKEVRRSLRRPKGRWPSSRLQNTGTSCISAI